MYVSAIPAYGKDYRSKAAVMADWNAGKDFLIQDMQHSGYVNISDRPAGMVLNVRYQKLTKVCVIEARQVNGDELITAVTQAATADEALRIVVRAPRQAIDGAADLLHVETDGHSRPWICTAIVTQARS